MFGDIVERRPATVAAAREILSKVKKPNYEQKAAFEYASKFAKLSAEDAGKLAQELAEAEIPRLKERHVVKLIDLMPGTADEIKSIFAKEDLTLSKDDIDKVLEILAKYR